MNTQTSLQVRFWQKVSILTLALLVFWSALLFPYFMAGKTVVYVQSVLAGTSGILLAMSLSLSSFSYYFNFLDSKIVYRKYLGLMGYFFAMFYTILVVQGNPILYLYSFPHNLFEPTVGLGIVAMTIFTVMALISNQKAVGLLGGKNWKTILGLGYVAYALLVMRGILLDGYLWIEWFSDITAPFTVRMFLTLLGILVLLFRVSVPFHQKYAKIK